MGRAALLLAHSGSSSPRCIGRTDKAREQGKRWPASGSAAAIGFVAPADPPPNPSGSDSGSRRSGPPYTRPRSGPCPHISPLRPSRDCEGCDWEGRSSGNECRQPSLSSTSLSRRGLGAPTLPKAWSTERWLAGSAPAVAAVTSARVAGRMTAAIREARGQMRQFGRRRQESVPTPGGNL